MSDDLRASDRFDKCFDYDEVVTLYLLLESDFHVFASLFPVVKPNYHMQKEQASELPESAYLMLKFDKALCECINYKELHDSIASFKAIVTDFTKIGDIMVKYNAVVNRMQEIQQHCKITREQYLRGAECYGTELHNTDIQTARSIIEAFKPICKMLTGIPAYDPFAPSKVIFVHRNAIKENKKLDNSTEQMLAHVIVEAVRPFCMKIAGEPLYDPFVDKNKQMLYPPNYRELDAEKLNSATEEDLLAMKDPIFTETTTPQYDIPDASDSILPHEYYDDKKIAEVSQKMPSNTNDKQALAYSSGAPVAPSDCITSLIKQLAADDNICLRASQCKDTNAYRVTEESPAGHCCTAIERAAEAKLTESQTEMPTRQLSSDDIANIKRLASAILSYF